MGGLAKLRFALIRVLTGAKQAARRFPALVCESIDAAALVVEKSVFVEDTDVLRDGITMESGPVTDIFCFVVIIH